MAGIAAAIEAMFAIVVMFFVVVGAAVVAALGFLIFLVLKFTGVL